MSYARYAKIRDSKGFKDADVSRGTNVAKATLSSWKNGNYEPKADKLEEIAKFLGVTVDMFTVDTIAMTMMSCARVPVYGAVRAGIPMDMNDEIVDYLPMHAPVASGYFGVKVKGNSMEPLMFEGDTLLVRRQPDVENGEIAVVSVGGTDATVKKVKKMQNSIMLIPLNNEYDPMIYAEADDVRILGRVTEIRRKI